MNSTPYLVISSMVVLVFAAAACRSLPKDVETDPTARTQAAPREEWENKIAENS